MVTVSEFFRSPSLEFLEECTKDQLLEIGRYYGVEIDSKRLKENFKAILIANLTEKGVFLAKPPSDSLPGAASLTPGAVSLPPGLTFEQQRELLRLQFEIERVKLESIRESRHSDAAVRSLSGSSAADTFDVLGNLRLLPQFQENDPDSFFLIFERLADARKWDSSARALLLQCVLVGRAQEAFSVLSVSDSQDYVKVKAAVLQAYELVPEAYRQRFRSCGKAAGQSYLEFARDLKLHFTRWCSAAKVADFERLCELILLTYICEQKAETVAVAAALADDYVLTHKSQFLYSDGPSPGSGRGECRAASVRRGDVSSDARAGADVCHYCRERGHWKGDCPVLSSRGKTSAQNVNPTAFADPGGSPVAAAGVCTSFPSKTPIRILRDTGAYDSYVVGSVLPFSSRSATGDYVVGRGMGLTTLPTPLHRVVLDCELVRGEVSVGVRAALPVDGIHFILGNGLAGGRVWSADPFLLRAAGSLVGDSGVRVTASPVVALCPSVQGGGLSPPPRVFPACADMRAMCAASLDAVAVREDVALSVADFPLEVSHEELVREQRADPSLTVAFGLAVPGAAIASVASGYFVHDGLLFRKWTFGGDRAREVVFQLVVPSIFRTVVLGVAHDDSGHFGVRKTYLHLRRHFFWPGAKKDVSAFLKTCRVVRSGAG
ncbi:uncharacterized protein LOC121645524 [Melanotaenia boesemani]|uniref:uncharacterized protein LOC121645524 n=1 Tax=Melanotaenia boesemani TaxID=1250792 RepID=UPI001C05266F|nr:uncharacterized protein LOC121645524 [Melanotaenia boesemani]